MKIQAKSDRKPGSPGRPAFIASVPRGKFTFKEFQKFNGVNPATGKGTTTRLTLWNILNDNISGPRSLIRRIEERADATNGTGRRAYMYMVRRVKGGRKAVKTPSARKVAKKVVNVLRRTRKPRSTGIVTNSATYEAQKAEIMKPATPVTVPAVSITPAAPLTPEGNFTMTPVAPAPAPVAETKVEAPAAPESTPATNPEPALAGVA